MLCAMVAGVWVSAQFLQSPWIAAMCFVGAMIGAYGYREFRCPRCAERFPVLSRRRFELRSPLPKLRAREECRSGRWRNPDRPTRGGGVSNQRGSPGGEERTRASGVNWRGHCLKQSRNFRGARATLSEVAVSTVVTLSGDRRSVYRRPCIATRASLCRRR